MDPSFYLQVALHGIVEWLASFGVAYWISLGWSDDPPPLLVRWARHRERLWIAIAFVVAPAFLSFLLQGLMVQLYTHKEWAFARLPVILTLSAFYGACLGVASSCAVAPGSPDQPFSPGRAGAVSGGMIVLSLLTSGFIMGLRWLYLPLEVLLRVIVLVVVRVSCGGKVPASETPPALPPARGNLAMAVVLGFLPSALGIGSVAVATNNNFKAVDVHPWLWALCVISIACCFFASRTLFSRKTGGAIAGGVVLLLLNGFIAFFFGCCATLIR